MNIICKNSVRNKGLCGSFKSAKIRKCRSDNVFGFSLQNRSTVSISWLHIIDLEFDRVRNFKLSCDGFCYKSANLKKNHINNCRVSDSWWNKKGNLSPLSQRPIVHGAECWWFTEWHVIPPPHGVETRTAAYALGNVKPELAAMHGREIIIPYLEETSQRHLHHISLTFCSFNVITWPLQPMF